MKTGKFIWAGLFGLMLVLGFASCSDDNEEWWQKEGSGIEMSRSRAFVLNEGSYGMNNARIGYFAFDNDEAYAGDVFEAQNGRKIGDTAQDLICSDGSLYLVVAGSKYLARLDGVGKEQARMSFAENADLGDPRYVAASHGKLYVTSYGGYVNKIDALTLRLEGSVKVGRNPEQIVASGGKIYCVNSGWGFDNTLSVIDEKTFGPAETVTIMDNPQRLVATASGKLVIQGTGADFYSPRVDVYDTQTGTSVTIGEGSSITSNGDMVYVANSVYDGDNGYSTDFYSYNVKTGARNDKPLKNVPAEMEHAISYGISVNPYTNHIYVTTTLYNKGDGSVYHFDAAGNYIGKITSFGQNPSKIVFARCSPP